MYRRRYSLGSNADLQTAEQLAPQIGSAVGGPVGQGIGQILSVVGQLFGGKVHTTPSGATYHQATATFKDNELAIEGLISQYNAAHGLPPPNIPPIPVNGDSPQYFQWMSSRVASYLNQPSLATSNGKQYDQLKSGGAFDAAIRVQNAVLQQLAAGVAPSSVSGSGGIVGGSGANLGVGTLLVYGVGAILLFKILGG